MGDDYPANREPARSEWRCYCSGLLGLIGGGGSQVRECRCVCERVGDGRGFTEYDYKWGLQPIIGGIKSLSSF